MIQPLAIHLPQFHPFPENDEWWGKGFTEWTNVTKAKAFYTNHYQPQLPTDLGFYDLRLAETLKEQAALALRYGIGGFAYYHYWFMGKRLLHKPVEIMSEDTSNSFPYCLIWANETWSRRWLGEEKEILIKQEYSDEDTANHARHLCRFFSQEKYIKINGRPLFVVYRPSHIPELEKQVAIFKNTVMQEIGIEPYLLANNTNLALNNQYISQGFDAIFSFRPELGALPNSFNDGFVIKRAFDNLIRCKKWGFDQLKIYDYSEALQLMQLREGNDYAGIFPSLFVNWDNTARRGRKGIIIENGSPELFKQELIRVIQKIKQTPTDKAPEYLFINAWNEWAEGNHLEPCVKYQQSYLQVIKEVVDTYL